MRMLAGCLAGSRARARARWWIQPARRALLNPDIKSFPTRGRAPSETEIQILLKSSDMHHLKMAAWPCTSTCNMDEKVSATDECYRARGCLLKFRAHCETTERPVNMRSYQAARAPRARVEAVSNSSEKSVSGTYLKIPIRKGNPYSNRAKPI